MKKLTSHDVAELLEDLLLKPKFLTAARKKTMKSYLEKIEGVSCGYTDFEITFIVGDTIMYVPVSVGEIRTEKVDEDE